MNPNPDRVEELYSLAANGDKKAKEELIAAYSPYIHKVIKDLQQRYGTSLSSEDLFFDGVVGLLESLRSLELNIGCPTYSGWIEKNIHRVVAGRIFSETRFPHGKRRRNE